MKYKIFPIAAVFVCLLTAFGAIASAQDYTITDLGSLSPAGINSWAQVVGNYNNQAFSWTKRDGRRALGILVGGTFSNAAAINDLGVVTGSADGPGTVVTFLGPIQCTALTQPFLWKQKTGMRGQGAPQTLLPGFAGFSPPCEEAFYPTRINDLGRVVGYSFVYSNFQWGFLWTAADGFKPLLGGGWPPTFLSAISNLGQIVGQNSTFEIWGIGHATSWKNGVAIDLGTLGGGPDVLDFSSSATGVNDYGQVAGWSTTTPISFAGWTDTNVHAVSWTASGVITDLGTLPGDTLSAATKVNLFGQVIGSSGNTAVFNWFSTAATPYEVIGRPFVWSQQHGMRDLNTLIPANSGWVLNSAADINVWGQIVGQGMRNGQPHGFILTPKNPF